ncbi:MAG: hypothetical protein LBM93_10100, partial [Oscillospiraceae bacterium]|nr:hypothetical protein [Oscillospiraceae bacterium]
DVTILSDVVLPTCKNYFKYNDTPQFGYTAKNWNVSKTVGFSLKEMVYKESRDCKLNLSDKERGVYRIKHMKNCIKSGIRQQRKMPIWI